MTFAAISLTTDPVWPWSLPAIGAPALLAVAAVLVALTLATYLVAWRGKRGRLLVILGLRLTALLVVYLLLLRPSLAEQDDSVVPSKLLILVDASRSMAVNDELNNQSRWERARGILRSAGVEAALKRLQDKHKVEVVYYQGAENVARLDLGGKADGKRTDMGAWLHNLLKAHGDEKNLRGLLLFTDGADNGSQYPTLEEAARCRNVPCPIQPFALGSATTTPRQRDIAFAPDKMLVTPVPVRVKNKLTVKGVLNAYGFENAQVTLRLLLDDKEVAHKDEILIKTTGNDVEITCDAPEQAGEVKVTLKVDPLPGEVSMLNNEVSTYATVTKDGLSILWVEGKKRAFESVFAIRHVLSRDPRFRVYYTELVRGDHAAEGDADRLDLKKRHFDVIVIGDITAGRFSGGKPDVFRQVKELVEAKQTGLLMLGGYETFANSDWQTVNEINELLPVELTEPGQMNEPIRVRPTAAAFNDYVLGHPGKVEEQQRPWEDVVAKLDGMTRLGKVREGATVYATSDDPKEPVLVGRQVGKGRVLAFAGDTTWKAWRRTPEAIKVYDQFWRQVMLWLAHQEKSGGSVSVEPDTRRLAAGNNNRLGFTVRIRGKTGRDDVKDARFTAKVVGPGKDETEVPVVFERDEFRGSYWKTNAAGEYLIKITGMGTDTDGKPVEGSAEAKVLAYAEDLESLRPAADHDFLAKLASAGGGKLRPASETELERLLDELNAQPTTQSRPRAELWPDWRRDPASSTAGDQVGALWTSGALVCFLLFGALVCTEWFLRRRWGMV
jgi:uncharacterized membrane protein